MLRANWEIKTQLITNMKQHHILKTLHCFNSVHLLTETAQQNNQHSFIKVT